MSEAKQKADEAKLNAYDVLMRTNRTKQRVDQSNKELRGLIKQIRDFLTRTSPRLPVNVNSLFERKQKENISLSRAFQRTLQTWRASSW